MLQIDLEQILRSRVGGRKGKYLVPPVARLLARLIHQDELNEMLRASYPHTGHEFSEAIYSRLRLEVEVRGLETLPESRYIFASNHPLGGLDGIGLAGILGKKYGDANIRFLVNDMLMHVEPLREVFVPINKYGRQAREAAGVITDLYKSDKQVVIFPAGLVSRLGDDGAVRDLTWHPSFVRKAIKHRRDVVPVRFDGLNRMRFYRVARWRKRLLPKINIEQAMLPAELCAAHDKKYTVTFGTPIPWQALQQRMAAGESPESIAASLKAAVYAL